MPSVRREALAALRGTTPELVRAFEDLFAGAPVRPPRREALAALRGATPELVRAFEDLFAA